MGSMLSNWYVLHTYSGYENKVKNSLEKLVESNGLQESILQIVIPTVEYIDKNGEKLKKVTKKVYPGYVFVKMVISDEMWYRVRNIRGVTGFVGPTGKEAVPLSEDEINFMGIKEISKETTYSVGDVVEIEVGVLKGHYATVKEVDFSKKRIKAVVNVMGENIVDIEFSQVSPVK